MSQFVDPAFVFVNQVAHTKQEILELLASKAHDLQLVSCSDELLQAFVKRENQGSTGLVGGIAIPHATCGCLLDPSVIVLKLKDPIDWQSIDKKPVSLIVALLIPQDKKGAEHLKSLSKLASLFKNPEACNAIMNAQTADELAQEINKGISHLS